MGVDARGISHTHTSAHWKKVALSFMYPPDLALAAHNPRSEATFPSALFFADLALETNMQVRGGFLVPNLVPNLWWIWH